MIGAVTTQETRFDRRKARTRAALVGAAQELLAQGLTNVSIQEVTESADVGLGSFYNHFASKDELFEAAVQDALETLGAFLDSAGGRHDDPAEVFCTSFRLMGRLHRVRPSLSQLLLRQGHRIATSDEGLAPRARRDLEAARDAGRFTFADLDVAMVMVTGATIALGQLLHDQPDRDEAATVDDVTAAVLVALGLPAEESAALAAAPLSSAVPTSLS
ncbi:TetR family transcriptional regulator [Aeromicrobium sp. Root495]|uniref:TetR/AcrR family transcriptional regulator n=1 Tax=Aeromicrobium sp. Root495 TaxID=1736550 RepID=UPI0006F5A691|nr:TetR/AcrR family transcriptional regulator [Aeromicrobium sp. Root495]KQY59795.1 TetR family transcriptional regulator [Aeromicrobium sp. Root495]